ncbi:MAG: PilZ domain-containing protein [Desulfobacter sp.]|nr:MAG: PilZ domain-containing protein [Desulfobacter sp.]
MTPLKIIFSLILTLISLFVIIQLIRLFRKVKQTSGSATAKNIYVIKYNNDEEYEEPVTESRTGPAAPPASKPDGTEKRRYPRREFQGFVDFIKEGTLYKEKARDLSYSGIFIRSNTPDKYKKNDFITMTFQTDQAGPQKRNGRIVRIDTTGIGVNFVP